MLTSTMQRLSYLTPDLPGIGGTIKLQPEDFLVEEQPLYATKGEGEHLYLFIEKRGQTTSDVVRRVAKMFRVSKRDVGYAGLKDKHAVTRQHLSVYLPDASRDQKLLSRFEFTPFKLLWSDRHHNKLRRGHLAANRFVIYIRHVPPTAVLKAKAVIDRLAQTGVANYVGSQRFGYRCNNDELGRLLLLGKWQALLNEMLGRPMEGDGEATRTGRQEYDRGDYEAALAAWPKHLRNDRQALDALRQGKSPHQAVQMIDLQQREYLISALQSGLFNLVAERRIQDGLFDQLVAGDLAWKHDNRSVFTVDEQAAEQENSPTGRVPRFELSPSGPMWGRQMYKPTGQVLDWEIEALHRCGIGEPDIEACQHVSIPGNRRPMRVQLRDPEASGGVDEHGNYVRVAFELPRGSFATVVLREIMKNDETDEMDDEVDAPAPAAKGADA